MDPSEAVSVPCKAEGEEPLGPGGLDLRLELAVEVREGCCAHPRTGTQESLQALARGDLPRLAREEELNAVGADQPQVLGQDVGEIHRVVHGEWNLDPGRILREAPHPDEEPGRLGRVEAGRPLQGEEGRIDRPFHASSPLAADPSGGGGENEREDAGLPGQHATRTHRFSTVRGQRPWGSPVRWKAAQ
jgi:hypothetical protein